MAGAAVLARARMPDDEYLTTLRGVLFEIRLFHDYWTQRLDALIREAENSDP